MRCVYIKRLCYILIVLNLCSGNLYAASHSSDNYTLHMPRIVPSGGSADSSNYSIKDTSVGSIFGGVSESADFRLYANYFLDRILPRLSISLNPVIWPLNSVVAGSSKITDLEEKITVLNDGNIRERFSMQVIDGAGTWEAADTIGGNDLNKYLMSGIFTGTEISGVDEGSFNELGNEDLILESTPQISSGERYATTLSDKNGSRVPPNEERFLWLKFDAPRADTTQEQHDIWLIIGAELYEQN